MNSTLGFPIFVTGGAGFIGSHFVHDWILTEKSPVVNLDKLTYAGNLDNLDGLENNPSHVFIKGDVADRSLVLSLLRKYQPQAIINFAAETHVDRSISNPTGFMETNVLGSFHLLECAREYFSALPTERKKQFRFLHISTDEVLGSLHINAAPATEDAPYLPRNPYSASKAAADFFVRTWFNTYGLPVLITNSTNNYGPRQYPEKLISCAISHALSGRKVPIHGRGLSSRDWLHVKDHCAALRLVLRKGRCGQTYNIGRNDERQNIEVVKLICHILAKLAPDQKSCSYQNLIEFVKDRPGVDFRYALDASKITRELGWKPKIEFEKGLEETIKWFVENQEWFQKRINL